MLADLVLFKDKVRDDGFIIGHDFSNEASYVADGCGVVPAVRDFRREFGYELLALTSELYPTFVLTPEADGKTARALVTRLSEAGIPRREIANFSEDRFQHFGEVVSEGRSYAVMAFF